MALIWLVGKSNDLDMLWNAYPYEYTENPEIIKNINLFEEISYKYNFNKKHIHFFKQNHKILTIQMVIKGIPKVDTTIMKKETDIIYNLDSMNIKEKIRLLLNIHNIQFTQAESFFLNQMTSLEEVSTLMKLKQLEIESKYWPTFFNNKIQNWYKKMKDDTLFPFGIHNINQIIPIITYLINANDKRKPPLLFLQAKINQGISIWELNNFWKNLIDYQ